MNKQKRGQKWLSSYSPLRCSEYTIRVPLEQVCQMERVVLWILNQVYKPIEHSFGCSSSPPYVKDQKHLQSNDKKIDSNLSLPPRCHEAYTDLDLTRPPAKNLRSRVNHPKKIGRLNHRAVIGQL